MSGSTVGSLSESLVPGGFRRSRSVVLSAVLWARLDEVALVRGLGLGRLVEELVLVGLGEGDPSSGGLRAGQDEARSSMPSPSPSVTEHVGSRDGVAVVLSEPVDVSRDDVFDSPSSLPDLAPSVTVADRTVPGSESTIPPETKAALEAARVPRKTRKSATPAVTLGVKLPESNGRSFPFYQHCHAKKSHVDGVECTVCHGYR